MNHPNYPVKASEVKKVWKSVSHSSNQIPESGTTVENLGVMISEIKQNFFKSKKIR